MQSWQRTVKGAKKKIKIPEASPPDLVGIRLALGNAKCEKENDNRQSHHQPRQLHTCYSFAFESIAICLDLIS